MLWLVFQAWNRIQSARMPRVATENPSQPKPGTMEKSVPQECLASIARAGRLKATTAGSAEQNLLERRNDELVEANQKRRNARERRGARTEKALNRL